MKQIDILTIVGKTCKKMSEEKRCNVDCPFGFINEPDRKGCSRDFLYDEKIAKQVLNIIKQLQ